MEPSIFASNPPTNLSPLTSIPDSSKITVPREAIPPSPKTAALETTPLISSVLKASSKSEGKEENEESARFAKAKLDIQDHPREVINSLSSYNLTPQHIIELAKLIVQNPFGRFIINFRIGSLGITDQAALVEIAKLAVQQDKVRTLEHIANYGITSQTALIEIVRLALVDLTPADVGSAYRGILKASITDQTVLLEMAKLLTSKSTSGISIMGNLGITDPMALIELVKLNLQKCVPLTLLKFANYRISDPTTLVELAKFAAQIDGKSTSSLIKNFGITDQTALFEIATLAIKNHSQSPISNYGLTSQSHLIALAKQTVQLYGHIVLSEYGITSQADLMIIAKMALLNPKTNINKYFLKNIFDCIPEQYNRLDLLSIALLHARGLDWNTCNAYIRELCGEDFHAQALKDARSSLPQINDKAEKQSDILLKARLKEWVGVQQMRYTFLSFVYISRALSAFSTDNPPSSGHIETISKEFENKFESTKLIQILSQLFALGSMQERSLLAQGIFQFLYIPENLDLFTRVMQGMPEQCFLPIALACLSSQNAAVVQNFGKQIQEISRLDDGPKMRQLSMLLWQLAEADLTPDQKNNLLLKQFVEHAYDVHALLDELPFYSKASAKSEIDKKALVEKSQNLVGAFLKKKESFLKLEQPELKTLTEKLSSITRPQIDKQNILTPLLITEFLKGKRWIERLQLLNVLISIGQGAKIAQAHSLCLGDLQSCLRKEIVAVFELNEKDFASEEEFRDAWQKCAEIPFQERHPQALFVYASKINSLIGDERTTMKKLFSQFVSTLLKGPEALHKWRMECPHFDAVDHLLSASPEDKTTLEKWNVFKKEWSAFPSPTSLSAFIAKKEESEKGLSNRFQELLENTLKKDGHVADWESQLPFLHRYLHTSTSGPLILKELSEIPSDPQNNVQKVCLQLCIATTSSAAEMLLPELSQHIADLKKTNARWNLWNTDIESFVNSVALAKKGLSFDKWKISLTRAPVDMLLLASETSGCQSIDGDADLNKCALAYVIDYKNSAIVIKDDAGKIKFRAILRVLYDQKNSTPVLFLERLYSSIDNATLSTALKTYAVNYAAQVGWPLLTTEAMHKGEAVEYAGSADSLGSNAALEYSDAGGGITHGTFHITRPLRMS